MTAPLHVAVYPPLEPAAALRVGGSSAFPFDRDELVLTHLGRGAVWLALKALGLGEGHRIAMPAYHCGSEVEAARLAGLEIDFYRVDGDLRVDEDDLNRAAAGADAAYLISNFGFAMPPLPPGVPVIEDAAHALFSLGADGPIGGRGQAAIFCPRKSLGVPDGGAVLVAGGADTSPGRPALGGVVRSAVSLAAARAALARARPMRAAATALIARSSRSDAAAREGSLTETVIGEWDLEVDDMEAAARAPARLTERLVRGADADAIRARRRENYGRLLAELGELAPEPHRELPEGVAPLYFPALVPDRDRAIAGLLEHGVRPLEVWPVPHPLLDRERYAELEPARHGLLALPVHQRLREWHMDAVVAAAKRVLG